MKLILSIFLLLSSSIAMGATCSSTTRNNYTTNQVLTSSALNSDFNQLVTKVNAFDGGCISDDSLEATAVDSSWDTIFKAAHQGCKVSYSDANTLSVGKCLASVNGNLLATTSANTVTWGCSGCSAEVASTTYYLYIKTGSSGTTMNLLISTTAPNEDGYDNSGNKVVARFYSNASSDIDQYSIDQWHINKFIPYDTGWISDNTFTFTALGTVTNTRFFIRRDGKNMDVVGYVDTGTTTASTASITLPAGYLIDTAKLVTVVANAAFVGDAQALPSGNFSASHMAKLFSDGSDTNELFFAIAGDGNSFSKATGSGLITSNVAIAFKFYIPVVGWSD